MNRSFFKFMLSALGLDQGPRPKDEDMSDRPTGVRTTSPLEDPNELTAKLLSVIPRKKAFIFPMEPLPEMELDLTLIGSLGRGTRIVAEHNARPSSQSPAIACRL